MNILLISQYVGVISILLLFLIKFYIAVDKQAFQKAGRVAILWTSIYVFFLFVLRLIQITNIANSNQLRIISGFTTIIPLIATVIQLWFNNNEIKKQEGV